MTTDIGRIVVPANEVCGRITATVTVSGMKTVNVRCWLAIALIRIAAWVLPFDTHVHVETNHE